VWVEKQKVFHEINGVKLIYKWCRTYPCLTVKSKKKRERDKSVINQLSFEEEEKNNNHLLWIIYWQRNLWRVGCVLDARCDRSRKDSERSPRIACVHSYHILRWVCLATGIICVDGGDGVETKTKVSTRKYFFTTWNC
jgi:hypothetical protein